MKSLGFRLKTYSFKSLLIISIVLLTSSCQSLKNPTKSSFTNKYHLVSPGSVNIGLLKFTNPEYWSEQRNGGLVSWTKDGILLNEVVFGSLLKGQNILGQTGAIAGDFDYDPQMSSNLLVEHFTDALTNSVYHNVILLERSKLLISDQQAVKFKISYDANSNVNYSAWALFIKRDDQLITVFCSAPSRHYFPMLEDSCLEILDSIQLI